MGALIIIWTFYFPILTYQHFIIFKNFPSIINLKSAIFYPFYISVRQYLKNIINSILIHINNSDATRNLLEFWFGYINIFNKSSV